MKPKNRYYLPRKPDAKKRKIRKTATNTKTEKPKHFGKKTEKPI